MSTSDGRYNRPRIGDMLKSAFAPRQPIDVDPDAPNPIPRGVKIGGGLIIASGAINLFFGLYSAILRNSLVDDAVSQYNALIDSCRASGIGIGSEVTSTDTSDTVTQCKSLAPLTQQAIDNALSSALTYGIIMAVVGIGAIIAGVGVLKGGVWARRLATPLGALLLIATFLNLLATLPGFVATLLIIVGLTLLYIGKGANYFIRAKAKGTR